jgi:hypothetical protein
MLGLFIHAGIIFYTFFFEKAIVAPPFIKIEKKLQSRIHELTRTNPRKGKGKQTQSPPWQALGGQTSTEVLMITTTTKG